MRALILAAALTAVLGCTGCPSGKTYPAPTQLDTVEQVVAKFVTAQSTATTLRAETVTDYWLNGQRIKGEVRLMVTHGSLVRFNALSPAGGSLLLDLACDGQNFALVDSQNDCALSGPCDENSIAQLLHVPLTPDDFFVLAVGSTPVLSGGTGKVTWDSTRGYEVVELSAPGDASQTIWIDAREGLFDVVKSEMRNASGAILWLVENKDFRPVANMSIRLPGTTRIRGAAQHSDAIVEWRERSLNIELPPKAFDLPDTSELRRCGQQ